MSCSNKEMMSYIDRTFRGYGEEFFGEKAMNGITDEQVEEARCFAMRELAELTAKSGRQAEGTAKELFLNYIFGEFM